MDHLRWEMNPPKLRQPILVCAFRGWNDAASAASTALETLADSLEVDVLAEIDPEEYFLVGGGRVHRHQQVRDRHGRDDVVRRVHRLGTVGVGRHHLGGPSVAVADAAEQRDLVLLDGTEPNLKWRTYSETVVKVAEFLKIETVVVLGSLIAEVAHTLPVPITGLASDERLIDELGLERSDYEGPTGIVGVVHDRCRAAGIASASLWAAVPHYVAAVPNPKAALALTERLERITGVTADISGLEDETASYEEQIGRAVAADPEVESLVSRIEDEQRGRNDDDEEPEVPSGDALAIEFQRFLKNRDDQ